MAVRLNDAKTLEAIGILAGVLDGISGPERLECMMAANALRQVLETKSETALSFARQAFDSLDGDVRQRIHDDATEAAYKAIEGMRKEGVRKPAARRPAQKSTGGPVLDALNGGMKTERKW